MTSQKGWSEPARRPAGQTLVSPYTWHSLSGWGCTPETNCKLSDSVVMWYSQRQNSQNPKWLLLQQCSKGCEKSAPCPSNSSMPHLYCYSKKRFVLIMSRSVPTSKFQPGVSTPGKQTTYSNTYSPTFSFGWFWALTARLLTTCVMPVTTGVLTP